MSQYQIADPIHEQSATIETLQALIASHETIRRILRELALGDLTIPQAISRLHQIGSSHDEPARQALYQQAIADLRQMKAEEL